MSVFGTNSICLARKSFSGKSAHFNSPTRRQEFSQHLGCPLCHEQKSNNLQKILLSVTLLKTNRRDRILTVWPSHKHHLALSLGSPNPWMIVIAKETLDFRREGLSPSLRLLMPTFSLLTTPPFLTIWLRCDKDAPLPRTEINLYSRIFGIKL